MQDYQYFKKNNLLSKVERVTNRWVESLAIEATTSVQWDWLMENTHKIKVLKASGGEPFYDNKVIQLLQKYVETGAAKNTMLIFHTNATQFNEENVAMLNQFKKNKHTFSIDGTGKTYEYIRYPAVFSETEQSIRRYIKNVKNYDSILNFVCVVTAHNILNIDEYLTWSKKLYSGVCCQFSEVYSRDRGISIQHLSIDILTEAKKQAQKHLVRDNGLKDNDVANLIRMIDDAIKHNKENKQLVKDECDLFDMSRNQSYRDFLHPMIVEWLDND
jgi:sulfatase maturation enzyme AslB (radical SAM superfamily)